MNRHRQLAKTLLDILEIYLPMFLMFSLFVVFLIGIVFRYFFVPLSWTMELSLGLYLWVALFGSLYAQRKERHVVFSMIYDRLSATTQRIFRIVGNSLLAVSFLIVLKPSYNYINFMKVRSTNVLRIPFNLVYAPFLIFLVAMAIRFVVLIIRDVAEILSSNDMPETHREQGGSD
jgi:C4-dicarboxylate transporter DctQ subunit